MKAPHTIASVVCAVASIEPPRESCLLLDRGADPNARNEEGRPPLHATEKGGHDEVAALLRERSQ